MDGLVAVKDVIANAIASITGLPERVRDALNLAVQDTLDDVQAGTTGGVPTFEPARDENETQINPDRDLIERDLTRFKDDLESTLAQTFRDGNFDDLGNALLNNVRNQFTDRIAQNLSSVIGGFFSNLFQGGGVFSGGLFGGLFGGIFHQGGVVPGNPGEQKLILAQAGELVVPTDGVAGLGAKHYNQPEYYG